MSHPTAVIGPTPRWCPRRATCRSRVRLRFPAGIVHPHRPLLNHEAPRQKSLLPARKLTPIWMQERRHPAFVVRGWRELVKHSSPLSTGDSTVSKYALDTFLFQCALCLTPMLRSRRRAAREIRYVRVDSSYVIRSQRSAGRFPGAP